MNKTDKDCMIALFSEIAFSNDMRADGIFINRTRALALAAIKSLQTDMPVNGSV